MPDSRATAAAELLDDDLGVLPEWNLDDLYAGLDDPALKRDLALAESKSAEFEQRFKGKLTDMAKEGGTRLAESVIAFEELEELLGRIVSFAGHNLFRFAFV